LHPQDRDRDATSGPYPELAKVRYGPRLGAPAPRASRRVGEPGVRIRSWGGITAMESRIIGKIELDEVAVRQDVERILASPPDPTYVGYSFGTWNIYLLWNASGDVNDSILHEFDGPGRFTNLGVQAPYIASVIGRHFRTERMKWARAFLLRNGSIVPHRDYLEFKKPLTRIHLALFTHESSMHSEDTEVFHMRAA